MTTAHHPADALIYELSWTFASIYLTWLLAYWIFRDVGVLDKRFENRQYDQLSVERPLNVVRLVDERPYNEDILHSRRGIELIDQVHSPNRMYLLFRL